MTHEDIEPIGLSPDDSDVDFIYKPRRSSSSAKASMQAMSGTDWSLISDAASDGPDRSDSLERLARRYWSALYAFVRATGRSAEDAADLTQGFLCDVVLSRGLLQVADETKGRFRTLLLTSMQNYLRERHRYDTRAKRSHDGKQAASMDAAILEVKAPAQWQETPEHVFISRWFTSLMEQVLERVRVDCEEDEMETHWLVFEARVVRPILFGGQATPYEELIERLGLDTVSQASNMMVTAKRRFARTLREEVAATIDDPELLETELETMRIVLSSLNEVSNE